MKLKSIEQQVVVVVGASSGIGRETALQFAKRNAKVVVAARTESALASLVNEIVLMGGEALAVTADVAGLEQVHGSDGSILGYMQRQRRLSRRSSR
jgi:short-subunit dehydrogenase